MKQFIIRFGCGAVFVATVMMVSSIIPATKAALTSTTPVPALDMYGWHVVSFIDPIVAPTCDSTWTELSPAAVENYATVFTAVADAPNLDTPAVVLLTDRPPDADPDAVWSVLRPYFPLLTADCP